jgi:hypothetical protein
MDSTIKDLRKFIIKEMVSFEDHKWSTEGRKEYYTTKYVSIKKSFEDDSWCFKLNGGPDKFHTFKSIGINKYVLYFLFLFIKRNIKRSVEMRKNDGLKNEWNRFLDDNKDVNRDEKIDKIIKRK